MAKATKPGKRVGGPFLAAAVFCNSVTEDCDGVLSALRIVDEIRGIIPSNAPPDFPSKDKPVDISLFALIMIRRGDAHAGKHQLRLVMEQPNGKTNEVLKQEIEMPEYPNGTATLRARVVLKLFSPGVFWIDVMLGKERLSRMALNLVLQRADALDAATTQPVSENGSKR